MEIIIKKMKISIEDKREEERTKAEVEKQGALLEYIAIMSNVDLPEESEEENGEI